MTNTFLFLCVFAGALVLMQAAPSCSQTLGALLEPPAASSGGRYAQDFPQVRVTMTQLQVGSNGTITVHLQYTNKTNQNMYLLLNGGDQSFVNDNAGNRYRFDSASGIGRYYAYTRPRGPLLSLPARGTATATITFDPPYRPEAWGNRFSFSSAHKLGTTNASGDWRNIADFHVSIQNIVPAQ